MTKKIDWKISALEVLQSGPVVPVIVLEELEDAVPLAKALVAGGVRVLEVTLRTPVALEAIRIISKEVPDAIVGAGTVATKQDLRNVAEAGGVFAISPGLTPTLAQAAIDGPIALIPGVASASELMLGMEYGLTEFKFFPAVAAGGIGMLKSLGGPFPDVKFCATGGIGAENYKAFLELDNVACVGGSWLAPKSLMKQGQWQKITDLAQGLVA